MKYRFVQALQKYFLNPPIRFLLTGGATRICCETGPQNRQGRRTPVGEAPWRAVWLVAEHGAKAGYVRNTRVTRVRVKLRKGLGARWYNGTAHLLSDDDPRERQRWLWRQVPGSMANAMAVRMFGTQLLTVRIDLDS